MCNKKTATYCLSVPLFVHFSSFSLLCKSFFFSVKDFSATTSLRALKFGTKLDSDELYCVTKKTATYCLSVPLYVHFSSFSLLCKSFFFSVNDFSATTWVRILKFGTKLDSDELYCVRKEQPHIAYQSLYLFIFLSLQWKFLSQISQLLLEPVFSNFVYIFKMEKCTV